MSSYGICLIVLLTIGVVHSWVPEVNWNTIHDGRPGARFEPVTFQLHPRRQGQKVDRVYAAYYLDSNHRSFFGQTTEERDGRICAEFNVDNFLFRTCEGFRVLQYVDRSDNFQLIKPENYNPARDVPVEYQPKWLVMIWDPETESSYFGTLNKSDGEEPIVYAIDYNGQPVELRGQHAISGDYLLYIVK